MRRKHHEDHVNHEAWAIPYADLMTLLLAFFVVMYAVSVVNEGKYRVMSESILEAFNGSSHAIAALPATPTRPHNVDPALAAPPGQPGAASSPIALPVPLHPDRRREPPARTAHPPATVRPAVAAKGPATGAANLARIQDEVNRALLPLIRKQQVIVRPAHDWLEIELRTDILFPSGVARLSAPAEAVLARLAAILAPFDNPLRVEGYTDDQPISTLLYPSNWELSAARAASVARLFAGHGIAPGRLAIIGWGQFRPATGNDTAEGRNRNRRVLVVVLGDGLAPTRYAGVAGQVAAAAPVSSGATPDAAPVAAAPPPAAIPTLTVTPEHAR